MRFVGPISRTKTIGSLELNLARIDFDFARVNCLIQMSSKKVCGYLVKAELLCYFCNPKKPKQGIV